MADERRHKDIFGNSDIGPGQSAVTVAQGIPDPSKATAIESARYLNPLVGRIAEAAAAKGQEDPNKYRSMLNAERELRNAEDAARLKGGLTNEQRKLKQQEILDRYKDENPHLMEDFDKLAKRTQETYAFTTEDDTTKAQRAAWGKDVEATQSMGIIDRNETNPEVIKQGVAIKQGLEANIKRMDTIGKQLSIQQQELSIRKSEHDAGLEPLQDENLYRQSQIDKNKFEFDNTISAVARDGIVVSTAGVNKVLVGVAANQDTPTARAEAIAALQDQLVQSQTTFYQLPNVNFGSEAARQNGLNAIQAPIRNAITQLSGKDSLETIQNSVAQEKAVAEFGLINGPQGAKIKNLTAMRGLFGDNSITYNEAVGASIDLMYGDGSVNADGTLNSNSLYDVTKPKEVDLVYSQAGKLFKKANESSDNTRAMADDTAAKAGGSIMNGLKPDASGKVDPKAVQKAVDYFSDPNTNAWAVRFQPKWNPEVVKSVDYLITKTYDTPAFKSIGQVLDSSMNKTGKPLASAVTVMWQDNKVVIKPKEGLSPQETKDARLAINRIEDKLPALTKIVRASATRHNSNDFQGFTDRYANELYGVSNISNDPRSANEPLVREYMTSRSKAVGNIADEGQRKIAEAKYDRQNNASPALVSQARRLEQGLNITTPEEAAANAKSDLGVLTSLPEEPPTSTSSAPVTTEASPTATQPEVGKITSANLAEFYPDVSSELAQFQDVLQAKGASDAMIEKMLDMHVQELVDRANSGQPMKVQKATKK